MKLRGDVIFHLGSVIILVVSGALLRLGGRSESSGSARALRSPCLRFPLPSLLPPRLAWTGMDEMAGALLPGARIDLWCFLTQAPKGLVASGSAEGAKHEQHRGPNEEGAFITVIQAVFFFVL